MFTEHLPSDDWDELQKLLAINKAYDTNNIQLAQEIEQTLSAPIDISTGAGEGFQGGGFSGRGGTGLQMAADPSFAAMLPQDMSSIQPPMTPAMDFGAGEGFQGHGFEGDNIARIHAMSADPGWAAQDVVLGSQGMSPATLPTVSPENYGELSAPSDINYSGIINPQPDPVPTGGIYNRRDAGATGFGPGSVTPEGLPGSLVHPNLSLADRNVIAQEHIERKRQIDTGEILGKFGSAGVAWDNNVQNALNELMIGKDIALKGFGNLLLQTPGDDDSLLHFTGRYWADNAEADMKVRQAFRHVMEQGGFEPESF